MQRAPGGIVPPDCTGRSQPYTWLEEQPRSPGNQVADCSEQRPPFLLKYASENEDEQGKRDGRGQAENLRRDRHDV